MWYLLNGPIILIVSIFGSLLNLYAIYALAIVVFPIRTAKNSTIIVRFDGNSFQSKGYIDSPIIKRKSKRSRIFIHLAWLTGCDVFLLVCSIFNFSIPVLIDNDGNFYMKTMPIW